MDPDIQILNKRADAAAEEIGTLEAAMKTVIVGQDAVIHRVLIALLAGGHILLEGVPGIAKTLTIRTLAYCLACTFARIQFTPDLLPADIIGTKVYHQADASFKTLKGPIFHQVILADEINRAPPKVQSALLEAMQERQATIQGDTFQITAPFLVLATENPIESEGTYPLPDAQVDRFMLKVLMTYPSKAQEVEVLTRYTGEPVSMPAPVIDGERVLALQALTRAVYADTRALEYAVTLVDATRYPANYNLDIQGQIAYGASPRGSLNLILGAKANAVLAGRGYVLPEDIRSVAHDVLRHRILLTYEAEADGVTPDALIDRILGVVRVP
ncbi:MAG: MoxR family ATPase [Methanomicrobiales archaeon]|nr:MoxR family ATPase [Methanomicrobiales archaeon]